jgi:hypothetical protein
MIESKLAEKYKMSSSENERLQLCIEAINERLIYVGGSVHGIDRLFGTEFSKKIPAKGKGTETQVIDFEKQTGLCPDGLRGNDTYQAGLIGWYLAVEFDDNGMVLNYYITNIHK